MKCANTRNWSVWVGFAAVLVLYTTSFFLPALSIPTTPTDRLLERVESEINARLPGEPQSAKINKASFQGPKTIDLRGWDCFRESLRIGPYGLTILTWCANPLIWSGIVLLAVRRPSPAMLLGILATCLALLAAFALPYIGRTAADVYWSWYDYRVGYWTWLGSAVALAVASFAVRGSCSTQGPLRDGAEQTHAPEPAAAPVSIGESSPLAQ